MSLSLRDQSQVQGFSAWSKLNYFVYRKLSSWDAFFKWYHNRAKWNIFTVLAPAANTTNIDYEQSLIFLLLAVYDKQWSVSCEYTRPFILQPHQAPWWSQRTEHWPAWDTNNESQFQPMFVSFAAISFVLCHCFKAMSLSRRGFTLTEPYYYRLYLQSIRGSTNNYPFSCSSLLFMAPKLMRSHFKDLPNSRAKYYYGKWPNRCPLPNKGLLSNKCPL